MTSCPQNSKYQTTLPLTRQKSLGTMGVVLGKKLRIVEKN